MNDSARDGLRPVTPHDILVELIDRIAARLPAQGVDDDLQQLVARARALSQGLHPYLECHTSAPSPSLERLERRTQQTDWAETFARGETQVELEAEMLCGPVEARFLAMLVGISGARRVLEIGLFTGYSALAMAEALPTDGRLVALEREAWLVEFSREHFADNEHGRKITVQTGPAEQSLRALKDEAETFDLVFIDADKAGYCRYLDAVLDGLLAPGGLVVVDNTLLQGQPWLEQRGSSGEAIAAFNERVVRDERLEHVMIPLRDGISLIRVRST